MNFLLRHLELCLALTGLAVIAAVCCVLEPTDGSSWRTVAVAATAVCLGQGLIAWGARRHRQKQRDAALLAAQALLNRIVDQENSITTCMAARRETNLVATRAACGDIARLVTATSDALHAVASGSLRPQHADYLGNEGAPGARSPAD